MKKTFYIADPHFDHPGIISYCKRPFENVENMNETLIENWNKVVRQNDDVYIIGDFGFPKKAHQVPHLIEIAKRLKGNKHLIIGNHDKRSLHNPEFTKLFNTIEIYAEIFDEETKVVLFHYPIAEWNGYFGESIHIHGHIHNHENKNIAYEENRYNVGVELIDFTPITLDELIKRRNQE